MEDINRRLANEKLNEYKARMYGKRTITSKVLVKRAMKDLQRVEIDKDIFKAMLEILTENDSYCIDEA